MRALVLVALLSALTMGGYWALTSGWAPVPGGPASVAESVRPGAAPGGQAEAGGAAAPAPVRSLPRVEVDLRAVTYAVDGETPDAILQSLVTRGPSSDGRRFFGLTETAVDLRYELREASNGCVIEDAQVLLSLTITLPAWSPPSGAAPETRRAWARFRRALAGHEDRHRAIAEDGAEALQRAIDGLRRPDCEAVTLEARRRLGRLEGEIGEAHRRYDAETGHGRTEGAVWPSP